MTKTCAFLAAVSAFILLGVGANAATLDFETPGQCGGPEVKITTGTAETACDVEMVPNNTDGLLATTPDNSFWTARFTSAVASISVDLGDFGEDADATFLAVYDASNTLLGETHFDIAMYDDSMYTLSKSFGNNFISYAIFGTQGGLGGIYADNLTYSYATTSPVPLPAAGGLMVAAVGGLAALRRRRKSAA